MRILAIDTALDACSVCVANDESEELLGEESMTLARGHAEALLPLIERVMARIDGDFESLDRVAVTVGPGSYTGLRVGLSAARAIGLAANIPVVGVTTLSALLAPQLALNADGLVVAAIDARHGAVYLQAISGTGVAVAPARLAIEDAVERITEGAILVGSGAPALAAAAKARGIAVEVAETGAPQIGWVAQLGLVADPEQALPRPLYLRGADAQPQDHARIALR
ncbi:tRNA (adenosine(37)-N6)-threonylcarbamoyltransferase complex dimerization subunit type 1 TsaB [Methylobacterium haplocladii]|uniref:tRNA (Adenosine(37)-N6)-threonylcarbamoyltransferase complex dimerization subunit type 1 TsaB n=1 Tax=Methylobacterium haplocladii TaxID=1176176 RepID=A0A512IVA8_9HYPH|nr:tRNA (adenosine(37)-N6)-threonylcarbamoyltransferase complex dimerization subunit type 1 TsaB [Methylobacterium haplocladii]GEP01631.1 tRNA (adenosine(37)-N6)-threonylcarbamoyltransferase complex dimerization subunit type 1 TsaB [Methylobacterium haplocladii]GJD85933.1 tRNA threonylcarbamoyladenosine biosynthesis protein TsaB [Methylobacterium haplocladii]GLS59944.1 tRNA (adenosine(37)-N6)-threonylcarbamoyltransferase complex dimerization subunit type 1 TsaB [Methylobacterium haplocladii]